MGLFSSVSFLFQSLYNLVVGFSFSLSSSLFLFVGLPSVYIHTYIENIACVCVCVFWGNRVNHVVDPYLVN
jgi:hypothetical protein